MVNFTCPVEHHPPPDPVPFLSHGNINFKAHDVGWLVCGFMALIACGASFWLVWKHLTYYTCPPQQRHIVRMLFMVPIYSLVSFASYLFYRQALYYQVIRDCYEAVTITSFFLLLLQYVGDTPEEQHIVFRQVKLQKWFFPLGFWKYRPDGLKFLWLMKICILQYAIFRPLCTILTVGMEYMGVYCLASWMPWFGHLWMALIITISVSIAMYCVVQFYLPISEELKPYDPVLKFLAVKAVVFLTFWQESFLAVLISFGAIKDAKYWSAHEIGVGLGAILSCFEMVIFGFLHIKAFSYKPYCPADPTRTTRRLRAFGHVLDFRDWFRHMKQSSAWAAANRKGEEFTLVNEIRSRKYEHLLKAMGKERLGDLQEMREQRREEKQARFWRAPADRPWDEKGMWDAEGGAAAEGGEHAKHVSAARPDGGLYTVAELKERAKLEAMEEVRGSHHHGGAESRAGGGSSSVVYSSTSKLPQPKMDELRRLASVLDEDEDEDADEDGEGRSALLRSPRGGRAELSERGRERERSRGERRNNNLDTHPELSAYHTEYRAPLAFDLDLASPQSDFGKGFAEEVEDEYRSLGLWPTYAPQVASGGRGQYSLTGQHDDDPAQGGTGHVKQRSWWRAFKERISGSGVDDRREGSRGAGWAGGHLGSQGGPARFEEPGWLDTNASRPSFSGTFPGRRSSLAIRYAQDGTPQRDAVPAVKTSFERVSGWKEVNPRQPTSPTSPGRGGPMQIPRKPVPGSHAGPSSSHQTGSNLPPASDASAAQGPAQPWLFEQRQSPLSKLITSQVQARDSSLKPSPAATADTQKRKSEPSPTEDKTRPIFHPARPNSYTRSIESASSSGHGGSTSPIEGPQRNKSMSASVRVPSESGTFGHGAGREATEEGALTEDFHSAHSDTEDAVEVGNGAGGENATFAVGNIVSRAAVADAQWGPQVETGDAQRRSHRNGRQSSQGPVEPSHRSRQSGHAPQAAPISSSSTHRHHSHQQPQPPPPKHRRGSQPASGSSMSQMGPGGMPLNAVGAMLPSASTSSSRSRRHSDQHHQHHHHLQHQSGQISGSMGGSGSRPRASFNRYTGEPMWTDGYGRSVSRDWVAANAGIPSPPPAAAGRPGGAAVGGGRGGSRSSVPTSSPGSATRELEGGFGQVVYID
ncbi:hypothetical protein V8E36_009724 [Tilletia maclaganii]